MSVSIAFAIGAVAAAVGSLWFAVDARRRRRDLSEFARTSTDLAWATDAELAFRPANADGYGALWVGGLGVSSLHDLAARIDPIAGARLAQALDAREPFGEIRVSAATDDATSKWYLLAGAPIRDRAGRFAGYRGLARNISLDVANEAEIAEKSRALDTLQGRLDNFTILSADWLWEEDADHRIVYLSSPSRTALSDDVHRFIGVRRWERAIDRAANSDMEAHKADLAARRTFRDFRLLRTLSDGSVRTISVSGRPIFTADGAFAGYRGTSKDITDELATAERARTAEATLLRAFELLPMSVAIFDAAGKLVFFNQEYAKAINIEGLLMPGIGYLQIVERLFAAGRLGSRDNTIESWHKEVAALDSASTAARNVAFADGRAYERRMQRLPDGGFAVIALDVTAETARAREIAQKTQILERMINNIDEGIIIYDADAKLVACNRKAQDMLDAPPEFVTLGRSFQDIVRFQIERGDFGNIDDVETEITRRLARNRFGQTSVDESWRRGRRYIQTRRSPLPDGGWVTLLLDLTDRRENEEALRRTKEAAEAANRAKSDFLAHMSHELRTPLNAVIGFSEIIARELFGPVGEKRYAEYARDIHASGTHLLNVIGDILDISKAESGSAELDEAPIATPALAAACLRLIAPRAAVGQVRVASDLASGLPMVRADERRMKQVLINLLANAVKFTPPGGLVTLTARLDGDGGLELCVTDTGIGMRAEDIPRALEPFAQIDSARARRLEGTGLGLPLSRKLVELHGGTLSIRSEIDKGTTVAVRLPATRTIAQPPLQAD
jgi:signal transduction histidine kinase